MKRTKLYMTCVLAGMLALTSCAPSVNVTPAGNSDQFEITVNSQEFSFDNPEELIKMWHEKARETCRGNDYKVISRDILKGESTSDPIYVTGIIECQ